MTADAALKATLRSLEVSWFMPATTPDRPVLALLAVDLDQYYTAIEATLEAVVRAFDGPAPKGGDWHARLLDTVGQAGDTRPPVLGEGTVSSLLPLMRFRHFMRHAYAVELDWEKLKPLARSLAALHATLHTDLAQFRRFVEECLEQLERV